MNITEASNLKYGEELTLQFEGSQHPIYHGVYIFDKNMAKFISNYSSAGSRRNSYDILAEGYPEYEFVIDIQNIMFYIKRDV